MIAGTSYKEKDLCSFVLSNTAKVEFKLMKIYHYLLSTPSKCAKRFRISTENLNAERIGCLQNNIWLFSEPWIIFPRPTTFSWSNPTCALCRILTIRYNSNYVCDNAPDILTPPLNRALGGLQISLMYPKEYILHRGRDEISVADPDPGSGAFWTLDPGSGIGFFRIPDPKTIFLWAFWHFFW